MSIFSIRRIYLYIFPVISGILSGIALLYMIHWLAWIMLVPLFYSILKDTRQTFLKAALSGLIQGLIFFFWIIATVDKYSGFNSVTGPILWIAASAYFASIVGLQAWLFIIIQKKNSNRKNSWWLNALAAGSIWIIIDWIRTRISPGIPWLNYEYLVTQIKWEIPLQLSAFTGSKGLTFLIVVINALLCDIIITKKITRIWLPVAIYLVLILFGFLRYDLNISKQKTIKVALICENLEAKERWSSQNGDSLAAVFFDLNRAAEKVNPNLIVWSESAIPWNLAMNDEFITRCLKITWPSQAGHIIGIFSPSEKHTDKSYNSAYFIRPDGAITGRYDKVQLLTFLEKPLGNLKIPFFNYTARTDLLGGEKRSLLQTPFGNAGVLICNETLSPLPFRETLELNADFFVVLSNDAWFEGYQLNEVHFYYNRLRAIESGLDMIINSNRGISGIIDSKGRILIKDNSNEPKMISGNIRRNNKSFYAQKGDWIIIFSALNLIILFFTIISTKSKKS